jgi:hypothetical protein
MKQKVKYKHPSKLSRKKVEDGILTYLQGGICTTDLEFGEAEVKFKDKVLFHRGLGFKTFSLNGVSYTQATKDESKLTITYLFH